jgi:hypothetical protein
MALGGSSAQPHACRIGNDHPNLNAMGERVCHISVTPMHSVKAAHRDSAAPPRSDGSEAMTCQLWPITPSGCVGSTVAFEPGTKRELGPTVIVLCCFGEVCRLRLVKIFLFRLA